LEEVKKGRMKNTKERGLRMKTMHALIERHLKALEEVKKGRMKNTKERPEDENDACIDKERH